MAIKTAKSYPAAYYLCCPECDEDIAAPCGSLMWTRESAAKNSDGKVQCWSCGAWSFLPSALRPSCCPAGKIGHRGPCECACNAGLPKGHSQPCP